MSLRTIGVLGGMGPAATAHFLGRLVVLCAAEEDQDYPPCLVYNASHVPDRTRHLVGDGEDPTPHLQEAARVLENGGAGIIGIPCNTAHAYVDAVRESVSIPVLNMIELAASTIAASQPGATVGVLACHRRRFS